MKQRLTVGNFLRTASVVEALEGRTLLTSIVVNTSVDAIFPPSAHLTSLRMAIATANNSAAPTTIKFDTSIFSKPTTIALSGSPLEITNPFASTTVVGPSARLTISGNNLSRVIDVSNAAVVSLSGVTISNGKSTDNGAGIRNSGFLTLTNVAVTSNSYIGPSSGFSGFAGGGGIFNLAGTVTVVDGSISANSSSWDGAGIDVYSGSAALTNVTLWGNTSAADGAGVSNSASIVLVNVTVASNHSSSDGGGMANFGTSRLINTTIAGNTCEGTYGGGGIGNFNVNKSSILIGNTIVAGNSLTGGVGFAQDAHGFFSSLGHNLIARINGSTGWNSTDLTGTDTAPVNARLGALSNNGASVLTMLPQAGSPAIDHGANANVPPGLTIDERHSPRTSGSAVDVGAVEVQVPLTASISGKVFNDANGNGIRDTGEIGLGLWQVFIDYNKDGKIDGNDVGVMTDALGNWSFAGLVAGTYTVRVLQFSGTVATKPTGGVLTIKLSAGQSSTGNLFGEKTIA